MARIGENGPPGDCHPGSIWPEMATDIRIGPTGIEAGLAARPLASSGGEDLAQFGIEVEEVTLGFERNEGEHLRDESCHVA